MIKLLLLDAFDEGFVLAIAVVVGFDLVGVVLVKIVAVVSLLED